MKSLRTRLLVLVSGIAMSAGVLSAPASATSFSMPQPPSAVTSALAANGVKVTWAPSPAANPPITNYIVHAGPDSCPITVAANATSAVMPIIRGPLSITPVVQAVNAYGFSTNAAGNAVTVPDKATPGFRNVQFLEFSDFHGAIEASSSTIGAAVLATALAADRKTVKSTFTVSVGDNIGGAPVISSAFDELPTIEALNLMKLDVSTFGNHEHDRPIPHLRQMIDASQFDWVASNYSTLAPLKGKVNAPTEFVIEERGGVKVGFVGMNTPDVAELVFAGNLSYGKGLSRSLVVSPALARGSPHRCRCCLRRAHPPAVCLHGRGPAGRSGAQLRADVLADRDLPRHCLWRTGRVQRRFREEGRAQSCHRGCVHGGSRCRVPGGTRCGARRCRRNRVRCVSARRHPRGRAIRRNAHG
ncbi:MAG: hypothetical protein NTU77_13895 [Actinobacteria bacterium]|nr:hypothetical protein [Actinomycetota bacterium]